MMSFAKNVKISTLQRGGALASYKSATQRRANYMHSFGYITTRYTAAAEHDY